MGRRRTGVALTGIADGSAAAARAATDLARPMPAADRAPAAPRLDAAIRRAIPPDGSRVSSAARQKIAAGWERVSSVSSDGRELRAGTGGGGGGAKKSGGL